MNKKTLNLTWAALIAALYVVITFVANAAGLASGAIQVRLSEMLTIMPLFTWAAVPAQSFAQVSCRQCCYSPLAYQLQSCLDYFFSSKFRFRRHI